MSEKRYPEEFKVEAVKQVTERGYKVREVAQRLGEEPHDWFKRLVTRAVSIRPSAANRMSCDG